MVGFMRVRILVLFMVHDCVHFGFCCVFFFFKQKTAYEMRISDWSSDVCSSDLVARVKAGMHYIAVNLVTSSLFLIGASLIYGVTGTLNMADLALRIPEEIGRASCRERVCQYV